MDLLLIILSLVALFLELLRLLFTGPIYANVDGAPYDFPPWVADKIRRLYTSEEREFMTRLDRAARRGYVPTPDESARAWAINNRAARQWLYETADGEVWREQKKSRRR